MTDVILITGEAGHGHSHMVNVCRDEKINVILLDEVCEGSQDVVDATRAILEKHAEKVNVIEGYEIINNRAIEEVKTTFNEEPYYKRSRGKGKRGNDWDKRY